MTSTTGYATSWSSARETASSVVTNGSSPSVLERVFQRLYIYGNGYSEFDYDRLSVPEWDELYPLADACFVALTVALTEIDALANHLLDLADALISSARVNELLPAEPTVHPPSVRSEPALAHGPLLPASRASKH